MSYDRLIVLLADGARYDILADLLAKGRLPNIDRYLVQPGALSPMVTAFPSTTGPAYMPYLTGCHPGTCNVPGIRWFDKASYAKRGWSLKSFRSYVGLETFLMPKDMDPKIHTAFELFDRPSSIFNMVNRGVHRGHNLTRHSRIWYIYYAHLTDRWSFVDQAAIRKLLTSLEADPDFSFVVFPGIDEYSHRSSPFHPRTLQAYAEFDGYVGQLVENLKNKGWLEKTLIMIVSDHGLSDTKTHFDVGPYLEEKGLKTFFYTQIFKRNFSAASMISGNGMAHIYLKGSTHWKERTTFEEISQETLLLEEFRLREEIDLVACQGSDERIHLLTKRGHGRFLVQEGRINYDWDHLEPLGIFEENKKNISMDLNESLERTFHSHYPDVFYQLYYLFKSRRTGDIVLSAKIGCDLRLRYEHPEHKASHGSICPEHMIVPFIINHPLKLAHIPRSMDVFPTMLHLMDKKIPTVDGKNLCVL